MGNHEGARLGDDQTHHVQHDRRAWLETGDLDKKKYDPNRGSGG